MFTRLDSERNSKLMKRAVNDQRLANETYKVNPAEQNILTINTVQLSHEEHLQRNKVYDFVSIVIFYYNFHHIPLFVTFTLKAAMHTMKEYVSLPAKRFVHLVNKYVHHRQMKEIEG